MRSVTNKSSPEPQGRRGEEQLAREAEFAIVTLTKDDLAGIRRTLASVDEQGFRRYEHVVVNGGSGSDVAVCLADWQKAVPEKRTVITDPPPGIYPAMNTGIRATSAPVVLILNGGDLLWPDALRRVSDHRRAHGWRWAYGGTENRNPAGHLLDDYTFVPFSMTMFRAGLRTVPHSSTYVSRELYQDVGLYREDLGSGADQEFFLRAAQVSDPATIAATLSVFETGGTSSRETLVSRELSWHRMRMVSATSFGGRAGTDLFVTGLLLVRLIVKRSVGVLRRVLLAGRRH